jgi:HSP20 family protein
MPLIPYRPFWDLERFFEEWPEFELPERLFPERLIPRMPVMRTPRMDIYETNGEVVAEVELPGVDPKNIDVEIKDNVLKVEAKAEEKKEEKKKGYYRKELSRGYFKRVTPLPVKVIEEKAEATYQEGVLKIVVPKAKPAKEEKKVKIKVKTKTT